MQVQHQSYNYELTAERRVFSGTTTSSWLADSKFADEEKSMSVFTIAFIVLLIAWLLGWGVFHVTSFLIHLLLIAAVIALVLHFVRGASRAV
jgi:Flp pilus assembly protein TadB